MSKKVEQWMVHAAAEIMNEACQRRTYQMPDTIAAIIASHVPSGKENHERGRSNANG